MHEFNHPILWFFILTAIVWLYRGRRALAAVHSIPKIIPHPYAPSKGNQDPLVTVIVPAKNEEKNIASCITALLHQDYPNIQIIVANDNSTDQTEAILKSLATPEILLEKIGSEAPNFTPRLTYFNCPATPPGWTGKNYAIHTAISKATGQWFLFTDADTRHDVHSISSALEHARSRDISFLTLLPRCLAESFFEHLIQPLAMGYLGLWFPMEKVNQPKSKKYFANGQYLLIERKLYEKIGGHDRVRSEFLEDFALMKRAKETGARIQCAFGTPVYGTRMYHSLASIWAGWRRIYLHAFRSQPLTLLIKYFVILLFSVFPFALFFPLIPLVFSRPQTYGFTLGLSLPIVLFILLTSWKTYEMVQAKKRYAFLHPVGSLILAMIMLDAFWLALSKQKTTWR